MDFSEQLTETTAASSSHDRLLEAAKVLFASRGYESTTTSAIAQLAHTSESQLVKHFGGKEGLLEGVFEQGWTRIMRKFAALDGLPAPIDKLEAIIDAVVTALEGDRALKFIFLFEGRRFRSTGESFLLNAGYLKLVALIDGLIDEMATAGQLCRESPPEATRSALIGTIEGLLRDHAMSERIGFPARYSPDDMKRVFRITLSAFAAREHPKHKSVESRADHPSTRERETRR